MALRHAARTAIQRSRVSLWPAARRRLIHGGREQPQGWGQEALTEELYRVVAEEEKKELGKPLGKLRAMLVGTKNMELVGVLSGHVKRRPHDADWRWFRRRHLTHEVAAFVAGSGFFYFSWFHRLHPKDCK